MKKRESVLVLFLYRTILGRRLLKTFTRAKFSARAGRFLNSRFSKFIVPIYIKKNGIDLVDCERAKYRSFNDFFIRKRKSIEIDDSGLISPCDGRLSVYRIDDSEVYRIKNVDYSLRELLKDDALASEYKGGLCLIFRLTPADYHRYCYPDDGVVLSKKVLAGALHCVRPVAYERFPVFVQNSREYAVIDTERFGKIVQMEIGALLVGKINNYDSEERVSRGREKGYFEFGGSTVVLLLKSGSWSNEELARLPYRVDSGEEVFVKIGKKILGAGGRCL